MVSGLVHAHEKELVEADDQHDDSYSLGSLILGILVCIFICSLFSSGVVALFTGTPEPASMVYVIAAISAALCLSTAIGCGLSTQTDPVEDEPALGWSSILIPACIWFLLCCICLGLPILQIFLNNWKGGSNLSQMEQFRYGGGGEGEMMMMSRPPAQIYYSPPASVSSSVGSIGSNYSYSPMENIEMGMRTPSAGTPYYTPLAGSPVGSVDMGSMEGGAYCPY